MGPLAKAAAFILVISFGVFVTFFGRIPALRHTPIGLLHRTIWIHIPKLFTAVDERLTGGRISRSLSHGVNRVLYDRHPTVVIFFLTMLVGGEYLFLPAAWPHIGWLTKLTALVAVALPYTFLYLACCRDPGFITPETHAYYMSLYPYDHALFHPGRYCATCKLLKPARSKHCSICKRCVAKADHHCVFINLCVGYDNHRWFLLLLLSTAVLTSYGGLLGLSLLSRVVRNRYPDWSVWPRAGYGLNNYLVAWSWAMQRDVSLGATTLLAALTSPLVWALLFYTLYHVYCGTTTNESLKWSEMGDDMADGYAFTRPIRRGRERDFGIEPSCSRWPVEPEMAVIATADGQPPVVRQGMPPLAGEGDWQRVWKLKNVENMYDLGFRDNLADIFVREYAFGKLREQLPFGSKLHEGLPLKSNQEN
ncbi:hypothetical protein NHJ13734_003087 [Beauveria thailandica]